MRVSGVTVRKRLAIVLFVGFIVFLIIDTRLGYVQLLTGDTLTEKAKDLWSRNIPFEPERGKILDRNDVALATNKSAPTVLVMPRQVENPAVTAEKLAKVLGASKEKVYEQITKASSSVYLRPEGRKISHAKANEVRNLNLKGVYIAEDSKRYYPFGSYLSHVLGFAGVDNQGLTGLNYIMIKS